MPPVEIASAHGFDAASLAAAFTAGYQDYWFPITIDDDGFSRMTTMYDVDLAGSRVARDGTAIVGIALLARRGPEGWVGGLGIATPHRRRGIGLALMEAVIDEARAYGLRRLTLEVLEQNEPARRLYERLGFRLERMLDIWTIPGELSAETAPAADVDEALDRIAVLRAHVEPWQRARETIEHQRGLGDDVRAAATDAGAIVWSPTGGRPSVLQLAAGERAARDVLLATALAGSEGGMWLNVPEGDPAATGLADLGGVVPARQLELALVL